MDFKSFKQKAIKFWKDTLSSGAKKLSSSRFTISKKEDLENFVKLSKTTTFTSKETWETKTYKHRVMVVFAEEGSDFFEKALYMFPVLVAKAFSQSVKLKLALSKIEWVKLTEHKVSELPSLVVYEEEKVLKVISGEENILKLVKSIDLDINKKVDSL